MPEVGPAHTALLCSRGDFPQVVEEVEDKHDLVPGARRYNRRMTSTRQLTAIIEREGGWYVALCPEFDIASQGETVEQARANLVDALGLFFESADPSEVERRLHTEVFVTRVEVPVG